MKLLRRVSTLNSELNLAKIGAEVLLAVELLNDSIIDCLLASREIIQTFPPIDLKAVIERDSRFFLVISFGPLGMLYFYSADTRVKLLYSKIETQLAKVQRILL